MQEPSISELLALIDGAINHCDDIKRLENLAGALSHLSDQALAAAARKAEATR
jgi:hypothetical protein